MTNACTHTHIYQNMKTYEEDPKIAFSKKRLFTQKNYCAASSAHSFKNNVALLHSTKIHGGQSRHKNKLLFYA